MSATWRTAFISSRAKKRSMQLSSSIACCAIRTWLTSSASFCCDCQKYESSPFALKSTCTTNTWVMKSLTKHCSRKCCMRKEKVELSLVQIKKNWTNFITIQRASVIKRRRLVWPGLWYCRPYNWKIFIPATVCHHGNHVDFKYTSDCTYHTLCTTTIFTQELRSVLNVLEIGLARPSYFWRNLPLLFREWSNQGWRSWCPSTVCDRILSFWKPQPHPRVNRKWKQWYEDFSLHLKVPSFRMEKKSMKSRMLFGLS